MSLLVAASILSIALNPAVFASTKWGRRFLIRHFAWARRAAMVVDKLSVLPQETPRRLLAGQVILVGEGMVSGFLKRNCRKRTFRSCALWQRLKRPSA